MSEKPCVRPIEILLVEDSKGDARLAGEMLMEAKVCNNVSWVCDGVAATNVLDGVAAMDFLRRQDPYRSALEPDVILLDLILPKMDGRAFLTEIKNDEALHHIPVVMLTSSRAEKDVPKSYDLHADGYIGKPLDLDRFMKAVCSIEDFWFSIVRLPKGEPRRA